MRKFVLVLVLLIAVGGMQVSAGGSGEAEERDTLVVGQIAEPNALDPHTVTAVNDFRILVNIYEGLVRFADGSLAVEPSLAHDWDISEDGTTYTFYLREGVEFHDGTPFNAEAVKFNFDRMLDEDHPYHDTGPFPLSSFFSAIENVVVEDEHTVTLELSEPFAPLLSNLAYPTGLMVSPTAVEESEDGFGRNPVGTGPFQFVEWESNTNVTVEAFADYWGSAPGVEQIVFRPVTDGNTRVNEMLSGGLDVIVEVPPDSLGNFTDDDAFTVYEQAGPHVWFLILNLREGPFTDRALRQAVNYAVDKESLVENVLQGTATVADSPIAPAFEWAYNEDLDPYPYDPDRAEELLEESDYDGEELVFYVTEGGSGMLDPIPMGTAIQADLSDIGLNVSIETFEWNTFLDEVNAGLEGKADMAQMSWMTNDPDTLPFLTLRTDAFPEDGGFNSGYYSNSEVDDLLMQARQATTEDERGELYREMQEIVYEDAPWLFVGNWVQNAVAVSELQNFRLQPSFFLELGEVTF
ncbi:MAG: ABC transporter substrate-binding protein [Spirochaetales bacterium]